MRKLTDDEYEVNYKCGGCCCVHFNADGFDNNDKPVNPRCSINKCIYESRLIVRGN